MQLGRRLHTDIEIEGCISAFRRSCRLPYLVLRTLLRHRGSKLFDAMGIVDVNDDRSHLSKRRRGRIHIQRRLAAAGQSQQ